MPKTRMELLAPVGSSEALRAAVQNGADAVYFGGKLFNARQFADNFAGEDLKESVRYAHLYGVRVYITVNTLVSNEELPELVEYLYFLYESDVDALIVQDFGVIYLLRTLFPDLPVHASTQMTIHNSPGVQFIEKWGLSRVVLAREVSLQNITRISEKNLLELEVFVHGALCVSYSGQCLMSSMIGGRSGNRGRCAQPCRLTYTLVDEAGREIKATGPHLLSPRDLKMIEHLPLLDKAKVASLKVEGRMKRPEYVATVIHNYRQALDEYYAQPQEFRVEKDVQKELAQIFNRDFSTGYYLQKPGPQLMGYQRPNNRGSKLGRVLSFNPQKREVTVCLEDTLALGDGYEIWVTKGGRLVGEIKDLHKNGKIIERAVTGDEVTFSLQKQNGYPRVGDRVFKTLDHELMERARQTFLSPRDERKNLIDFSVTIKEGSPVFIAARDREGHRAEVQGQFIVEKAIKHPLTEEVVVQKLSRLGETVFSLGELDLQLEPGLMVPVSELNALRREVISKIEEARLAEFHRPHFAKEEYKAKVETVFAGLPKPKLKRNKIKLAVEVGEMASLKAALEAGADLLYFGGERLRRKKSFAFSDFPPVVEACHAQGAQAILVIPRVFQEEQVEEIKEYCRQGQEAGVDGFLVGNLGALQLAQDLGISEIRGDYSLQLFNDLTVQAFLESGVKSLALSPELTLKQIAAFRCRGNTDVECLVHGRMPLMITEHCTIGNLLGKGHRERGCPRPCEKKGYGLRDRLQMTFPVESDENCRMHIFNTKTLNMLPHLAELAKAGVDILRIEAKREEPYWVRKVVNVYHRELERLWEEGEGYQPLPESIAILKSLTPEGFTTGHYFRGVE
ncbi:MAG: DUF3656 domain-containing U32 family peptidase [Peptococcia bacterium]|jgi:putative protease